MHIFSNELGSLKHWRITYGWLLVSLLMIAACKAEPDVLPRSEFQVKRLIEGALAQIGQTVLYDPAYRQIDYPGGDVPLNRGVCTDVVIRAFRHVGIDLQVEVHKDMRRAFQHYPQRWGLKAPDSHIDHRRVPNLRTYFQRTGKAIPVTIQAKDYLPGDIITWRLPNNRDHIGVLSHHVKKGRPLVVHNIGLGTQLEDILFEYEITGHYRPFSQ